MTQRAQFEARHPGVLFLDATRPEALTGYLRAAGVLGEGEEVQSLGPAGRDGLNCALRADAGDRTFIVKQSRPWREDDPRREVPWDRAIREIEFYEAVAHDPYVSRSMPQLLFADRAARLMVLEDVGRAGDWCGIYQGEVMDEGTVCALGDFLSALHALLLPAAVTGRLANREMRAMNRAEMFVLPLLDRRGNDRGGVEPGLAEAAAALRADRAFLAQVGRLSNEIYLADGPTLVHGDFAPGSFLRSTVGPRFIDAEFGFWGRPEVDVGVVLGHLLLGCQPWSHLETLLTAYRPSSRWSESVALQIAGVEIVRRLIGPDPLPLRWGSEVRCGLLERARTLVLTPSRACWEAGRS